MQYFQTLPKTIITQPDGSQTVFTNLMARVSVLDDMLNNPVSYYSYDIQEGDTPEIVADKYYGDSYRYWIVLLSNNILDPQWDWPLDGSALNDYIEQKYPNGVAYSTIHHYEKIISQYESSTQQTTVKTVEIDVDTYNTLNLSTNVYSFPSGQTTVTTTKRAVSMFEYELESNESKRSIKLIRKEYASQLESNLKKLMANG